MFAARCSVTITSPAVRRHGHILCHTTLLSQLGAIVAALFQSVVMREFGGRDANNKLSRLGPLFHRVLPSHPQAGRWLSRCGAGEAQRSKPYRCSGLANKRVSGQPTRTTCRCLCGKSLAAPVAIPVGTFFFGDVACCRWPMTFWPSRGIGACVVVVGWPEVGGLRGGLGV